MTLPQFLTVLDPIGYEWLRLLISSLWQTTLFFGLVYLLDKAQQNYTPEQRHRTWLTALLAAPLIPLATLFNSMRGLPLAGLRLLPDYASGTVAGVARNFMEGNGGDPVIVLLPTVKNGAISLPSPYAWLLILCVLFYAVLLGRFAWNFLRVRWWIYRSRPVEHADLSRRIQELLDSHGGSRNIRILLCPFCSIPFTMGVRNPVIMLPENLVPTLTWAELEAVLRHELAHVDRRDALTLAATSIAKNVLFFQPLAYLASSRVALLAETSCDRAVLRHGNAPASYARTLSRIAEMVSERRGSMRPAPGFVSSHNSFVERIHHILQAKQEFLRPTRLGLLTTVIAGLFAFSMAVATPIEVRPPAPAPESGTSGENVVPTGYPVASIEQHEVTAGYGPMKDPFTGEMTQHEGIDIRGTRGEKVYATGNGTVLAASKDKGNGKYVKIRHAGGFVTKYSHLDDILVREGQKVSKGDEIGLLGSTGKSTGPHLHYAIFQESDTIDPMKLWAMSGSDMPTFRKVSGTAKASTAYAEGKTTSEPIAVVEQPVRVEDTVPSPEGGIWTLYKYMAESGLYPEKARLASISGDVKLEVTVSATGKVEDIKVVNETPEGYGFAAAATSAIRAIKHVPGTKDGEAARGTYVQQIKFRLE